MLSLGCSLSQSSRQFRASLLQRVKEIPWSCLFRGASRTLFLTGFVCRLLPALPQAGLGITLAKGHAKSTLPAALVLFLQLFQVSLPSSGPCPPLTFSHLFWSQLWSSLQGLR